MKTCLQIDWRNIVRKKIWVKALRTLEHDLESRPWYINLGAYLRWTWLPSYFMREIRELAEFLDVKPRTLLMAQVVYDEAWAADYERPSRGCTSLSSSRSFGRNLDYGYPENAAEFVYHESLVLDGHEVEVEMFAGLMGWVALKADNFQICVNQAPSLRSIRRTRMPGMLWFREYSRDMMAALQDSRALQIMAEGGEVDLGAMSPAADILMQLRAGRHRFIAETFDRQFIWERMPSVGLVSQTNVYQLFDLTASPEWEAESAARCRAARSAGSVAGGLKAAAVEGWTIDTFMLR